MTKIERFDGMAVWRILPTDQQNTIGAIALEMFAAWYVADREEDPLCEVQSVHGRAASAALDILLPKFQAAVFDTLPAGCITAPDGTPRLPSMVGPICTKCGCSNKDACFPACHWANDGLCSACVPEGVL